MKLRSYLRGLGIGIIVSTLLVGFAYRNNPSMTDEEIKIAAEKLGMVEEDKFLVNNSGNDVIEIDNAKTDEADSKKDDADNVDAKKNLVNTKDKESTAKDNSNKDNSEKDISDKEKSDTDAKKNDKELSVKEESTDKQSVDEKARDEEVKEEPKDDKASSDAQDVNTKPQGDTPAVSVSGTAANHKESYVISIAKGSGSDTVARLLNMSGLVPSAQEFDSYLCTNGYDSRIVEGDHMIPVGASYEEIAKIITTR